MKVLIAAAASFALLLGACSRNATPSDYKTKAQNFIESAGVAEQLGVRFTDASCDSPGSAEIGTVFTCTATGADGGQYTFDVKIDKKNSFLITAAAPSNADTSSTTTPDSTDESSTSPDEATTTTTA
ncbi:MAG: hypothetical protein ABIQ39_14280 [Ilumatobacteraceae bacterium]